MFPDTWCRLLWFFRLFYFIRPEHAAGVILFILFWSIAPEVNAQVELTVDDQNPLSLSTYRVHVLERTDSLSLRLFLRTDSQGFYRFKTHSFAARPGGHNLGFVGWSEVDSLLSEDQKALAAWSGQRFPESSYQVEVSLVDVLGDTVAKDKFEYMPPRSLVQAIRSDSGVLLFPGPQWVDSSFLEVEIMPGAKTVVFEDLNDTILLEPSVSRVEVTYNNLRLQSLELSPEPQLKPRLKSADVRSNPKLPTVPVRSFSIDLVTLTSGAAFAERQFSGAAIQTPSYHSSLKANLNILGLPFTGTAYGIWLRHSQWPDWLDSPLNYGVLEFDKERFDQQYALDLSDGQVRDAVDKKRRLSLRNEIAIDQELLRLDSIEQNGSAGMDTSGLVQNPKTGRSKPRWLQFDWLKRRNASRQDSLPEGNGKDLEAQRDHLLKKRQEQREKRAEYDRLLHQIDSAQSAGGGLRVTDLSPSVRKEFAKAGLINQQMARLQSLEVGNIYPRRYVNEAVEPTNEYTGVTSELNLMKDLDLYIMSGRSRFSVFGNFERSALAEAGLVKSLGDARLSIIASRESTAPFLRRRNNTPEITQNLASFQRTFLILGYEHQLNETFSVGLSAEQRTSTLTNFDSLDFNGRYYAYADASYRILGLRLYGEYVDQSFIRNLYLAPIPGSVKTGLESTLRLFKGYMNASFGYEVLLQSSNPEGAGSSRLANTGFKYSLSTAFSKAPNVSVSYHPFYTSGRSQLTGGGNIVSFSSRSALSQATLSYAHTGGRFKMHTALQAQRIANAVVYDIETTEREINSQVDVVSAQVSVYNASHMASISASVQELDTLQNQNLSARYEYTFKPFGAGVQAGVGRSRQQMVYQFSAILKYGTEGFQANLEPGLLQFADAPRFYPTLNIQLTKRLWKKK